MSRINRRKSSSTDNWQHVGTIAQRVQSHLAYLRFIERATKPVPVEAPEPEAQK